MPIVTTSKELEARRVQGASARIRHFRRDPKAELRAVVSMMASPAAVFTAEGMLIHANRGAESFSFTLPTTDVVLRHHERLDGTGYPQQPKAGDLCTASRLLAVADVFDALVNHRPHRPAFAVDDALGVTVDGAGRTFDARMVEVLVDVVITKSRDLQGSGSKARELDDET